MRTFLLRLAAFAVLQAAVAAVMVTAYRPDPNGFFAAAIDKHALLAVPSPPRVLLAGGSNLSFGMDSARLSAALGRPVVNLAVHGGLGLSFILAEAKAAVRPGDVVVLSLECEHFGRDSTSDYLFDVLEQRPASAAYLSLGQARTLLDDAFGYAGRVVRGGLRRLLGREHPARPPYARAAFGALGDVVAHLDLPATESGGASVAPPSWRPVLIEQVMAQLAAL
jgi:hypothetical protein